MHGFNIKNKYIDKLDDVVNAYNNTYQRIIKMGSGDINSSTYIDFNAEKNDKDPKCKVGNHIRISKYKNIIGKGDTSLKFFL